MTPDKASQLGKKTKTEIRPVIESSLHAELVSKDLPYNT